MKNRILVGTLAAVLVPISILAQPAIEGAPEDQDRQAEPGPETREAPADEDVLPEDLTEEELEARSNARVRARELTRAAGFRDYEIDALHRTIASNLGYMLLDPDVAILTTPEDPAARTREYHRRLMQSDLPVLVRGEEGETKFLRLTLRNGPSYTTEQFPVHRITQSHCYIVYQTQSSDPHSEGDPTQVNSTDESNPLNAPVPRNIVIERIVFQYSLVSYARGETTRILQRLVHPGPFPRNQLKPGAVGEDQEADSPSQLTDNNVIAIEYYEDTGDSPFNESVDGVVMLYPGVEADLTVPLPDNENSPMPYERQVEIVAAYKRLIREIDLRIEKQAQSYLLEREVILNRASRIPF